ncbi:hypothetical protein REPUB_Repub06bG0005100 [Reevesia pubescens]
MPNGSLDNFIYAKKSTNINTLSAEELLPISFGVARGLEYLHRGYSTRILHLDIKPHNILLDNDLCPKIFDFGLAMLCTTETSSVNVTRGTRGIWHRSYCEGFGKLSHMSDVYSFGMMMLEMVGGSGGS